jgi:transposase
LEKYDILQGNSRWEGIISFTRKVKKSNLNKGAIIIFNNLKSHKVDEVKAEVKRLGIELLFFFHLTPPT